MSPHGPGPGAPVGVVVALGAEARCLPGQAAALGLAVMVGGVGASRAAAAAAALVEAGARGLVSWGTAAALIPELRAGGLVVATRVTGVDGRPLPTDAGWRQSVLQALADRVSCRVAPVAATRRALASAHEKAELRSWTGAAAADMESGAVARIAAEAGLPFLCLRAICDDAATPLPDWIPAALDDDGSLRPAAVLGSLLASPRDLPSVLRLAAGFLAAGRALRLAGRLCGPALGLPVATVARVASGR